MKKRYMYTYIYIHIHAYIYIHTHTNTRTHMYIYIYVYIYYQSKVFGSLQKCLFLILFLFAFNVPLTRFTSIIWIIILHEYKSLTHKLRSRWYRVMLQYAVIAALIQFAFNLVQISDFAIGKSLLLPSRASSMLHGRCDTGVCSSFTKSLSYIEPCIWAKDFELWFVSPKNFIPLIYCPVYWYLLTLFSFFISDFLTAILP